MAKNDKVDVGGLCNYKDEIVKTLLLIIQNLNKAIDYLTTNAK